MKRKKFTVRYSKTCLMCKEAGRPSCSPGWFILDGKEPIAIFDNRAGAIRSGAIIAKADAPSQLVVKNKNGRISFERTYGADPRRHKG